MEQNIAEPLFSEMLWKPNIIKTLVSNHKTPLDKCRTPTFSFLRDLRPSLPVCLFEKKNEKWKGGNLSLQTTPANDCLSGHTCTFLSRSPSFTRFWVFPASNGRIGIDLIYRQRMENCTRRLGLPFGRLEQEEEGSLAGPFSFALRRREHRSQKAIIV